MSEWLKTFYTLFGSNLAGDDFSLLLLVLAFLGGILASLTPCTLGILPVIISYVAGYGEKTSFRTFLQMVSFVLGLAFVMSLVGAISMIVGRVFTALGGSYWILIVASLLVVLGLNLLGVLDIQFPAFVKKMPKSNHNSLFVYPFVIGILFALASTPCSTPILVSIIGFASLSGNIFYATLLLFLFALGQGIIIILAGVFTSLIKNLRGFAPLSGFMMKLAGVLFILCGFMMYYNVFSVFYHG